MLRHVRTASMAADAKCVRAQRPDVLAVLQGILPELVCPLVLFTSGRRERQLWGHQDARRRISIPTMVMFQAGHGRRWASFHD